MNLRKDHYHIQNLLSTHKCEAVIEVHSQTPFFSKNFEPLLNSLNGSHKQDKHKKMRKEKTTFNGGSLGSCIDEERSKLRYVMWIAEISESSNLWTQLALLGIPRSMSAWVSSQLSSFLSSSLSFVRGAWGRERGWWADTDLAYLWGFKVVGEGAERRLFCFLPITTWCGSFSSFLPSWGREKEMKHLVRESWSERGQTLFYSKLTHEWTGRTLCVFERRRRARTHTSTCDLRSGKTTRWT